MFDFNKKKISLSIFLITLALISFISKVKIKVEVPICFDDTIDKNPTEWAVMDVVEVFGCSFNYSNTLFVLLLFIIGSILLFIFSDDIHITQKIKSIKIPALKWNIKLIIVSILVLVFILLLGKSCSDNTEEDTPKAIEEAPVAPYDTVTAAPAAEPADYSLTEEEINDSISLNGTNSKKNNNDKNIPSAFAIAKQKIQQTDEGITSGAGTDSGIGLSFEELRSQDASKNNVSAQLLSKYKSKGEKDK